MRSTVQKYGNLDQELAIFFFFVQSQIVNFQLCRPYSPSEAIQICLYSATAPETIRQPSSVAVAKEKLILDAES